ncbi:hypothetical protein CRG98_000210, partial [Punica granatum]
CEGRGAAAASGSVVSTRQLNVHWDATAGWAREEPQQLAGEKEENETEQDGGRYLRRWALSWPTVVIEKTLATQLIKALVEDGDEDLLFVDY